jgi:dTDP-glucose pyrophosphorylase
MDIERHIIHERKTIKDALFQLNVLAADAILFVVNDNNVLTGSLTDGDVRRGFLKGLDFDSPLTEFIQPSPVYIYHGQYDIKQLNVYKEKNFKIIPVVNHDLQVVDIINFRIHISFLPVDAFIMAGGEGRRLRPLTDKLPKPLLPVGAKPIIEHNIDRLIKYGIKHIRISINYLGEKIIDYFKDGSSKNIRITYCTEDKPLGTIGAISSVDDWSSDHILVMNSDLLTDIDFADFYSEFVLSKADLMIAATSYEVNVPYAVLETGDTNEIVALSEKPTYTYYSNAGIYLLNKEVLDYIPKDCCYDMTDLIGVLMKKEYKVISYPIRSYWLDIGKMSDYEKAQQDIKHLKL